MRGKNEYSPLKTTNLFVCSADATEYILPLKSENASYANFAFSRSVSNFYITFVIIILSDISYSLLAATTASSSILFALPPF
jgi:hypothetical protein